LSVLDSDDLSYNAALNHSRNDLSSALIYTHETQEELNPALPRDSVAMLESLSNGLLSLQEPVTVPAPVFHHHKFHAPREIVRAAPVSSKLGVYGSTTDFSPSALQAQEQLNRIWQYQNP
jgi:hypothetical protein